MFAEITAAIASTKTALEIVSAVNGLSNKAELVSAVTEVNAKLVQAYGVALAGQEKQAALSHRVAELEKELAKQQSFSQKIANYSLHQFPTGTFSYALKPGVIPAEPVHHLCATCVNESKVSILQAQANGIQLRCNTCKTSIDFKHITISRQTASGNGFF